MLSMPATLVDHTLPEPAIEIIDNYGELRRTLQGELKQLQGVTKAVVGVVDGMMLVQVAGGDVEAIAKVVKQHQPPEVDGVDLRWMEA